MSLHARIQLLARQHFYSDQIADAVCGLLSEGDWFDEAVERGKRELVEWLDAAHDFTDAALTAATERVIRAAVGGEGR